MPYNYRLVHTDPASFNAQPIEQFEPPEQVRAGVLAWLREMNQPIKETFQREVSTPAPGASGVETQEQVSARIKAWLRSTQMQR